MLNKAQAIRCAVAGAGFGLGLTAVMFIATMITKILGA